MKFLQILQLIAQRLTALQPLGTNRLGRPSNVVPATASFEGVTWVSNSLGARD